jgi:hypothetical protein
VLGAGQAQAVVVNVNGQHWNVTTFTGTYNDNISKFQTSANGGVMPWWGSDVVAAQFATAVGNQLGFPPGQTFGNGPYFGASVINATALRISAWKPTGGVASGPEPRSIAYTWAQAEPPAPAPGPLPVFGAAAAFGFSRKLRKRINPGTNPASSTYNLS